MRSRTKRLVQLSLGLFENPKTEDEVNKPAPEKITSEVTECENSNEVSSGITTDVQVPEESNIIFLEAEENIILLESVAVEDTTKNDSASLKELQDIFLGTYYTDQSIQSIENTKPEEAHSTETNSDNILENIAGTSKNCKDKCDENNERDQLVVESPENLLNKGSSTDEENEEKKKTRKRKKNTLSWKRRVAKRKRLAGEEYTANNNKLVRKRSVLLSDCSKCKLNCNKKFNEDDRVKIHKAYWGTKTYERQRDFICKNVKHTLVGRRRRENENKETNRRNVTYKYYFKDIQVCKSFFLKTLDIGEKTVKVAKSKENAGIGVAFQDKRGKHTPSNKTPSSVLSHVHKHINMFPQLQSHYCRKNSSRRYLDSALNVEKMYDLYCKYCEDNNIESVKLWTYRRIFNTEYNLYFHRPKKDSCKICERYNNLPNDKKSDVIETEKFQKHVRNKELSRQEKNLDKQFAKDNNNFKCVTFDLQSVLYTPCSQVSTLYYMRKFCTYNLTIFDQSSKHGECFVWNENEGGRGSSEIGTILYKYINNQNANNITHFVMWSDSCGGQNRNRNIGALLIYLINEENSLQVIDHKFLETGHTDMECDSMHSCIERAKRNIPVHSPEEWPTILKTARRKNPYTVHTLNHNDFFDLANLKTKIIGGNMNVTKDGRKLSWLNVKWVQVRRCSPTSLFIKTHYEEDSFTEVDVTKYVTKKREKTQIQGQFKVQLKKLYFKPLGISQAKKKDLINICNTGIIPNNYKKFYYELNEVNERADRLPEPDNMDESATED